MKSGDGDSQAISILDQHSGDFLFGADEILSCEAPEFELHINNVPKECEFKCDGELFGAVRRALDVLCKK